jgi:hypothetical protein
MQPEDSLSCTQEPATSVLILSQMNLVYVLPSHSFEICFNSILPSTRGSSSALLPSGFFTTTLYDCLFSQYVAHALFVFSYLIQSPE